MTEGVTLHHGDCLHVLPTLADGSVDAVICDPPAGIAFMSAEWDRNKGGRDRWIAWMASVMAECLRVARPGAYALVWSIPRTSHWTGMAIEDAGWEIRDSVAHLFGQGFPKNKACLKPAREDWWVARKPARKATPLNIDACRVAAGGEIDIGRVRAHSTNQHEGWDRPWKHEPESVSAYLERRAVTADTAVRLGRYPANVVLSHHPECERVGTRAVRGSHGEKGSRPCKPREDRTDYRFAASGVNYVSPDGTETVESWRCHADCPVAALDAQSGAVGGGDRRGAGQGVRPGGFGNVGHENGSEHPCGQMSPDIGGASRFFYCSKAPKADRGRDNDHPTVKNTDLMRWLCRLVTPPDGLILDPFMGSGSTGVAARLEGFNFVGIEQYAEYVEIAERRIAGAALPLFDGSPVKAVAPAPRLEAVATPLFSALTEP